MDVLYLVPIRSSLWYMFTLPTKVDYENVSPSSTIMFHSQVYGNLDYLSLFHILKERVFIFFAACFFFPQKV